MLVVVNVRLQTILLLFVSCPFTLSGSALLRYKLLVNMQSNVARKAKFWPLGLKYAIHSPVNINDYEVSQPLHSNNLCISEIIYSTRKYHFCGY